MICEGIAVHISSSLGLMLMVIMAGGIPQFTYFIARYLCLARNTRNMKCLMTDHRMTTEYLRALHRNVIVSPSSHEKYVYRGCICVANIQAGKKNTEKIRGREMGADSHPALRLRRAARDRARKLLDAVCDCTPQAPMSAPLPPTHRPAPPTIWFPADCRLDPPSPRGMIICTDYLHRLFEAKLLRKMYGTFME